MRTVVKSVIRSFSASVSFHSTAMNRLECNHKNDLFDGRRTHHQSETLSIETGKQINDHNEFKPQSFSYSYKLHFSEEQILNNLLDKEYDYYPDNSMRGDYKILNLESNNINVENNVSAVDIRNSLKTIRFINNFVFNDNPEIFLICSNYINQLLDKKSVKKDLMPFITASVYDLAVQQKHGKALSEDRVVLLLTLSRIPTNHLEDFRRMKSLLIDKLNGDLGYVTLLDYMQLFLRIDLDTNRNYISESYTQLLFIACILATSCELTYYTLSCQALSLISLAARHIVLTPDFKSNYSDVIDKIPLIFLSPTRLTQFANSANISEESINNCAESIIRYMKVFYQQTVKLTNLRLKSNNRNQHNFSFSLLETIEELDEANVVNASNQKNVLNIEELMDKLREMSLINETEILKQRQQQLNKSTSIKGNLQYNFKQKSVIVAGEDDDSAFSSSSYQASVSASPPNT